MSTLPTLPNPPAGVVLAVKVPSSVLYRDLSFRGNLSSTFRRVYGIDYAPTYVAYNAVQMWWDISGDSPFNRHLSPELKPDVVAQKFITITARNARQLVRTAQIVSSPSRWRHSHLHQDLLEDLNIYWDAYEDHMTCLYAFWNVENLITDKLIDELKNAGFQDEVDAGLPNFAVPSESNWFTMENEHLSILKSRFADSSLDKIALGAASYHANTFGFMSTLFNQGIVPSSHDVIEKMKQVVASERSELKNLDDLPENIALLGRLMRELAFWKHERQDAFALADQIIIPLYKTVSDLLEIPFELIYSMTRDEITRSIAHAEDIDIETIKQRTTKYCRALINGSIDFYQPAEIDADAKKEFDIAKNGDVFRGMPTSPGVVRGRVRILTLGSENPTMSSDEIIVASMTRPELGTALDAAIAYATDEGGRLCHAAIVSREKKKPCVVGLGNITKVLRTGMMIEVDGAAGTVTVVDDHYDTV